MTGADHMHVITDRDCNILGKGYEKGKSYRVSIGEGQMLLKNGFTYRLKRRRRKNIKEE